MLVRLIQTQLYNPIAAIYLSQTPAQKTCMNCNDVIDNNVRSVRMLITTDGLSPYITNFHKTSNNWKFSRCKIFIQRYAMLLAVY